MTLRSDADTIILNALRSAMPDEAVKRALKSLPDVSGSLYLVAIGKAAWQMAHAAYDALKGSLRGGIVITKYGHVRKEIPGLLCMEASHPVPDENSYKATEMAIELVSDLKKDDCVIFLISGGGSALFESPLIPASELEDITAQLLASGADIVEMNTIRKRLSKVKGGKFAKLCEPASIYAVILSDIIGDPLDMIASGPAVPDSSTCAQAKDIAAKYKLRLSKKALELLNEETPKKLSNVTVNITGSVRQLCASAKRTCTELGYETVFLTASLNCQAREAGGFLSSIAADHQDIKRSMAWILGGETIVKLCGSGLGGRNQEIALSAAEGIAGFKNTCVFSIGSDGTDGPTDAAGGYADGDTKKILAGRGIDISETLDNNDAYHALSASGGLIKTGPTGTNVNDLTVLLIKR